MFSEDRKLIDLLSSQIAIDYLIKASKQAVIKESALNGLEPLGFSGAMIFGADLQAQAFKSLSRHSLSAQRVQAVDSLIVTPIGLMGDFTMGRSIARILEDRKWPARNARVVIVGADARAQSTASVLASMGIKHLCVVANEQPAAEKALQAVAISTQKSATTPGQVIASNSLERADLLIRFDDSIKIDNSYLGPHLNLIDCSETAFSTLRQNADKAGAQTLSYKDVQAYSISTMLELILARDVSAEFFLNILHA